ncbi:hypothetical protein [Stakelama saccharophila]|uniref:Lipoprotein n=1 Tax=Stakelama saccharophila TaxID=3075605 RepID=A0ABZ0B7Q1_9SPHN|nr:hypothetical protein [Stakelama sp. W311]WNO53252.1 hypothetical protein RPR59_12480 [Stakelama sp. W311]
MIKPIALTAGAIVAACLAGCAATPEQVAEQKAQTQREFAQTIGNRKPVRTEDCINPSLIEGPQIVGDKYVVYRESGRRYWVSEIDHCPALAPLNSLIVELHGSQLCRNDQFRVLEPGASIPSAYCRFNRFTAYERPDTAGE